MQPAPSPPRRPARAPMQSVVLSGGYEDDRDEGEWFLYTGSGGRDLSGNKRTNKVRRGTAQRARPLWKGASAPHLRASRTSGPRCGARQRALPPPVLAAAHPRPPASARRPGPPRPAPPRRPARPPCLPPQEQSFDQEFTLMNEALRQSCAKGLPVRVVRRCGARFAGCGLWGGAGRGEHWHGAHGRLGPHR
jgi:hypothetical protein